MTQSVLWCGCGRDRILARGRCPTCYFARKYSERHFGGLRERILARDGRICLACGELDPEKIIVHHRRPGVHRPALLWCLCRACHARVHRTWRPRYGFPDALRLLWREQYPDLAEQLELALALGMADSMRLSEQVSMFESAA